MATERFVLRKEHVRSSDAFVEAMRIADSLFEYMHRPDVAREIAVNHQLHASSLQIQNVVLPHLLQLGFTPEKTGLFQSTDVAALRPDYYRKVHDTGILLEVERGKTTTNNMDLLDLWK